MAKWCPNIRYTVMHEAGGEFLMSNRGEKDGSSDCIGGDCALWSGGDGARCASRSDVHRGSVTALGMVLACLGVLGLVSLIVPTGMVA